MSLVGMEVEPCEVVYVKSIVEASEGLANVFAESGGSLTLACPPGRQAALQELIRDILADLEVAGRRRAARG